MTSVFSYPHDTVVWQNMDSKCSKLSNLLFVSLLPLIAQLLMKVLHKGSSFNNGFGKGMNKMWLCICADFLTSAYLFLILFHWKSKFLSLDYLHTCTSRSCQATFFLYSHIYWTDTPAIFQNPCYATRVNQNNNTAGQRAKQWAETQD